MVVEVTLILPVDKNYVGAVALHKLGPIGILFILTVSLAIFTVPGTFGAVVSAAGFSPQQATGAVVVTVLDCAGHPVDNAVVQVQGLGRSQWIYTGANGVATIVAPVGTYTVQGGYGNFGFSQTVTVGIGGAALTVNVGAGCSTSRSSTQTVTSTQTGSSNTARISR